MLEKIVFPRLREGARVLDLCCGTGDLSVTLAARGCQVTGIDGSEEMLGYAREKVPGAEFLLADARAFDLPAIFDAALSTFDSLNHILTLEELEWAFQNVWRALLPCGFFFFDMNMETCFRTIWRGTSTSIADDEVWIVQGSYDPAERIGRAALTMFRLEGAWKRSDVIISERCYSQEEITGALAKTGFRNIECHDAYDLGMTGDTGLGRSFFLAFK